MAYQYPEIKNFVGLHRQANSFIVPDGACEMLNNFVIVKDKVASKRRGFYEYYNPGASTLNHLYLYQSKLIPVFTDKIGYLTETGAAPNKTATFTVATGETVAVTGGRYSRSVQANKNFYFTTDNGVEKLESFSSKVYKSGTPPGLDLKGSFIASNGAISGNTQTAWRIVFGRRDLNDNLLLGAPSDILTLTNPLVLNAGYTNPSGNLVEVTSTNHNLSVGMAIFITDADDNALDNTTKVITATPTANTFRFDKGAAVSPAAGVLDYSASRVARLEFTLHDDITTAADKYFYQIYRTSQSSSDGVSPLPNFKLIDEQEITTAQITTGVIFYEDNVSDILLGAELYTNPNSREGELQANDRAPLCDDMTLFKNHVFYANCRTRHLLNLDVIDTSVFTSGDYIETDVGATTRRYIARAVVGNKTVKAESVSGTTTITITYTAHGLSSGDTILVSRVTGTLPEGEYVISVLGANSFTITSTGNSATDLDFQGVKDVSSNWLFYFDNTSSSVSVQLRDTAQHIIKAINRDDNSVVTARYTSSITGVPGKMRLQAIGFGDPIQLRANTTLVGSGFSPVLPTAFGDVESDDDDQPNIFYSSKVGEPEAVPLVNFFTVGSGDKEILRIVALRDSVIVLKEDGVFRVNGDGVNNFSTTILDSTVFCINRNSVAVLNNQIVFLSNQGVCLVTESSVQIVSRKIEDDIQPILNKTAISTIGAGVAYESERLYLLSTAEPDSNTATSTYCYNILNDSWSKWDVLATAGVIGNNDILYLISTGNRILRERKDNTKIDFCGQNYTITVDSVAVDLLSAVITSIGVIPEDGDAIVKSDIFNRLDTVTSLGANQYQVTFERVTNLVALDSLFLYEAYESELKTSPFHAGLVGRGKQFSQVQYHLRNSSVSRCTLSYGNNYSLSSQEIVWRRSDVNNAGDGWGFEPWGAFPWGNVDTININYGTLPAPVIRDYIPIQAQRGTYIQFSFKHKEAGEPINMQAISMTVRAYSERVSK